MKNPVVREWAQSSNGLVIGRFPSRVAPAHVFNGFVVAALGASVRGQAVRHLLSQKGAPPDEFALLRADWAQDPLRLASFRADMSLIFNPDRRLWEEFGSIVPVDAHLATPDPSDDGFGREMWSLVYSQLGDGYRSRLRELLSAAPVSDPVVACAQILASGAEGTNPEPARARAWYAQEETPGGVFSRSLAQFINALTVPEAAFRPAQIQSLCRGLYLSTFLALLLGPIAAGRRRERGVSVDALSRLVVWGGVPPGSNNHPVVDASARTLHTAVERQRQAIAENLAMDLGSRRVSSKLPMGQRRRAILHAELVRSGANPNRADQALANMEAKSGFRLDDSGSDADWCRMLLQETYSSAHVAGGLRSMGRKIGICGPDRGAIPRFVCETPLLGTIVAGLCPRGQSIPFEEFVDLLRTRLGLVFGPGTSDEVPGQVGLWESTGVARELLVENQDQLRRRLIRAGLAQEYSDGHTEVLSDG